MNVRNWSNVVDFSMYEQPSQKNSIRSTHNNVKWSKVEFCSNFNRMGCIYQINFLQLASYFSGWAVSCTFLFRWPPYRRPPPPNKPPKGLPPNSPPNTSPNMSPGKPGTSSHPAVKNLQSTIQNKNQHFKKLIVQLIVRTDGTIQQQCGNTTVINWKWKTVKYNLKLFTRWQLEWIMKTLPVYILTWLINLTMANCVHAERKQSKISH